MQKDDIKKLEALEMWLMDNAEKRYQEIGSSWNVAKDRDKENQMNRIQNEWRSVVDGKKDTKKAIK